MVITLTIARVYSNWTVEGLEQSKEHVVNFLVPTRAE